MNDTNVRGHFVLALTGPTGAGKTTIGEQLAKQLEHCVNIDADHIKHMIVSGFYVDTADPENPRGWGFSEWALVGESISLLITNFLNHGYDVIINGYIDEPAWHAIEEQISVDYKVLLLPDIATVIKRGSGRIADIRMGEIIATEHYRHFSTDHYFYDFIKLDTTNQTVEQTIEEIKRIMSTSDED